MFKNFYITTTIAYVNDKPHLGFAMESVEADAFARYQRLIGNEVFFNTGTDEHGMKIYREALKANLDPQKYTDEYAGRYGVLKDALNLSYTNFIRTTDPAHVAAAQEFWKRCEVAGDIYKAAYKIKYCVGCELEKTDSELEHGRCPLHPTLELEIIEEENYHFRLSRFEVALREYLEKPESVTPENRRQEALAFVNRGLHDFPVSRLKSKVPWGVPVPDDDEQVMYVWFDAFVNYISTLGWPSYAKASEDKPSEKTESLFEKFWVNGDTVQVAGKDQVRMQSIMWQGMLLSAGLPLTDTVFYHGFINSGGQRMSKTLGNVIDPMDLVKEYGTDGVRYFLLADVHPFEDSDVTPERIAESYNANLANGLGNLAARVMQLAETHLTQGTRPEPSGFPKEYTDAFESFRFNDATSFVWARIRDLDRKITDTEPFKMVKEDPEKGKNAIHELTQDLYFIARLLNPLLPATSEKIKSAIVENKKPETLFPRK